MAAVSLNDRHLLVNGYRDATRERWLPVNSKRLASKTALVTGAGSGIGRSITLRFAQEGAAVACADINLAGAEETARMAAKDGGRALALACDVRNRSDLKAAVERTIAELGALDIMVANAGISHMAPFFEMTDELWDDVMAVNVKGVFLACQLAAKEMVKAGRGGKILVTASIAAERAFPEGIAYCASKAAVQMMARTMSLALAPHKIAVNAIGPGAIRTPLLRVARADELVQQDFLKQIPAGRLGEPNDIANAAVFLASDESDYITGATLFVDGGWLVH